MVVKAMGRVERGVLTRRGTRRPPGQGEVLEERAFRATRMAHRDLRKKMSLHAWSAERHAGCRRQRRRRSSWGRRQRMTGGAVTIADQDDVEGVERDRAEMKVLPSGLTSSRTAFACLKPASVGAIADGSRPAKYCR